MSSAAPDSHRTNLLDHAEELLEAANAFQSAAGEPLSSTSTAAALERLEEVLLALSASCRDIAADAAPAIVKRWDRPADRAQPRRIDRGLSHERGVQLVSTLHDIAAAFGHCARSCREGRTVVAPLLEKSASRDRTRDNRATIDPERMRSRAVESGSRSALASGIPL